MSLDRSFADGGVSGRDGSCSGDISPSGRGDRTGRTSGDGGVSVGGRVGKGGSMAGEWRRTRYSLKVVGWDGYWNSSGSLGISAITLLLLVGITSTRAVVCGVGRVYGLRVCRLEVGGHDVMRVGRRWELSLNGR